MNGVSRLEQQQHDQDTLQHALCGAQQDKLPGTQSLPSHKEAALLDYHQTMGRLYLQGSTERKSRHKPKNPSVVRLKVMGGRGGRAGEGTQGRGSDRTKAGFRGSGSDSRGMIDRKITGVHARGCGSRILQRCLQ